MSRARDFADLAGSADAGGLTGRNLIINGAMQVAQRGTSSTGITDTKTGYFTVDRIAVDVGDSNLTGELTMSQESITDLAGFPKAVKFACTTADTSTNAAEYGIIRYNFEGFDVQGIRKGFSDARPVTVSFYVKGNAAAEYTLELRDRDNDRVNSQIFNVTTSWERVELTFAADTTGKFDNDNANSLQVHFWIHSGSTYNDGTFTSNTWASRTQGNRVKSSNSSFFDSTSRTLFITGLQIELGEQATPFEHRSYADELLRCQRYYEKITVQSYFVTGNAYSTAQMNCAPMFFRTTKRATPTIAFPTIGTTSGTIGPTDATANYVGTMGSTLRANASDSFFQIYNNAADGFSGFTDDAVCQIYSFGATDITAEAEL